MRIGKFSKGTFQENMNYLWVFIIGDCLITSKFIRKIITNKNKYQKLLSLPLHLNIKDDNKIQIKFLVYNFEIVWNKNYSQF